MGFTQFSRERTRDEGYGVNTVPGDAPAGFMAEKAKKPFCGAYMRYDTLVSCFVIVVIETSFGLQK